MNYEEVPYIITGKDLDYLSDMFNWNYNAIKCTYDSIKNVKDEDIKNILLQANDIFYSSINEILNIIGGKNE